MAEVLSYRSAPKRPPPKDPKWTAKRVAYYFALLGWFCLIAFWAGPNVWLFGRVTGLRESDLHGYAQERLVPVIRAMLEYKRDTGGLPYDSHDVTRAYFTAADQPHLEWGRVSGTIFWPSYAHRGAMVTYDFSDPQFPWRAHGPFYSGPINLPPVTFDTPFNPTTRPFTSSRPVQP